jgi:hypothetical protein
MLLSHEPLADGFGDPRLLLEPAFMDRLIQTPAILWKKRDRPAFSASTTLIRGLRRELFCPSRHHGAIQDINQFISL